jgi:class 3 adenylate cyclase
MLVAALLSQLLRPWEDASTDLRFRWRYRLGVDSATRSCPDVTVLAIDNRTQRLVARYGAGPWATRKPFLDQLAFVEDFFHPSALAYDIVFQRGLGEGGKGRGPDFEESLPLVRLAGQLESVARNPGQVLDSDTVYLLSRVSESHGHVLMADRLSSLVEKGSCPVLLGYNLRGGAVDSKVVDAMVVEPEKAAPGTTGGVLSYLEDMAIRAADVQFGSVAARQAYEPSLNVNLPARELLDYGLLAFLNGPPDPDGVVRRLPLVLGLRTTDPRSGRQDTLFLPSLALSACLLHEGITFPLPPGAVQVTMGKEIVIHSPSGRLLRVPIDRDGRLYLNFDARLDDFRMVSFVNAAPPAGVVSEKRRRLADALRESIDRRIVVVGLVATGIDVGACPIDPKTSLVHMHLCAIKNILQQRFLAPLGNRGDLTVLFLVFVCFTAVCLFDRSSRLGPVALLATLLYLLLAYAGVHANVTILPVIGPVTYLLLGGLTTVSYRYFVEEMEQRKIRGMFSTMVSDRVLRYLEENPESFSLSGHTVDATVFFSDIAGFTAMGESMAPHRLTRLLNSYLTPVTDNILAHGGFLDKYVGDGITAVWGAPYPDPEHAWNACRSALEQQALVEAMNGRLRGDYGVCLRVRMGLNSGVVTAGIIGSDRRYQYTVMGDVANVASRMEAINKDFGTGIILGESTVRKLGARAVVRRLGPVLAFGRQEVLELYELVGVQGGVTGRMLESIAQYEGALAAFLAGDGSLCLRILEESGEMLDGPARLLRARAQSILSHPAGPEWTGVYVQSDKTKI